jgi:hypothetical protein
VPEFPRLCGEADLPTLPPPELGEHTASVLHSAGVDSAQYEALLQAKGIEEALVNSFPWAPVRRESRST